MKEGRKREEQGKRNKFNNLHYMYDCFYISYKSSNIFIISKLSICKFILHFKQKLLKKKMLSIFSFLETSFYIEISKQNSNLLNNTLILRF